MVLVLRHGFFLGMLLMFALPWKSYAQNLDWHQIDENQAQFGFIGYQGARKNVAIDGSGNIISCAPFGNKVHVGGQELTANFETLIVKRNPAGQVLWSRTLNGNGFKYGHSIHADSLGNIYLLGWYYGNSSINGNNLASFGNYDCFLVKISSSGQILYTKAFGSAGYDYPFALDTDASGNVWVAGKFAFSMQLGTATVTGGASSHFLFRLNSTGSLVFFKNVCQNGGTDWGLGDLSRSNQGKIALVSSFLGTSTFQGQSLNGGGGYLAILDADNGDLDTVFRAGSQAWLVGHEPGGNILVLGLQGSNSDSMGSQKLPPLQANNQLYLARILTNGATGKVQIIPKQSGSFVTGESFRSLHVSRAGQIFLSGELESEIWISPNKLLSLNLPHQSGKPQAVLAKLDENFVCGWYAGVGSLDTVGYANKNIGSGVFSDPEGNIVWCTMNDAYSVVSSQLRLNNDTFNTASLSSRYSAHGIHLWKLSEPSVRTLMPQTVAYCPGDSIHVVYQKFGIFQQSNRFRLELSDSTGSFLNPVLLEEVADTASGLIHALIPYTSDASNFYRLRVNATSPAVFGSITVNNIAIRGKPLADAGSDSYFCLGDTVRKLAGGGGTYSWSGGDNILQKDSAWLIAVPDTHTLFWVRVYDSLSSCYSDDSVMLRFREKVSMKKIADTLACLGDTVVFFARMLEGEPGRLIYHWTDSLGNQVSDSDSLLWIADLPGRIRLVVWDSCSVVPDTQFFHISIRPGLKLLVTTDTLVCSNIPLVLRTQAEGGDPGNYDFVWMDSTFQQILDTGSEYNSLFISDGVLGLRLNDGCSARSDSLLIRIQVAEKPRIVATDSIMVCESDTVTLKAVVSGGYPAMLLYSWDNAAYSTMDSFRQAFSSSAQVPVFIMDECGLISGDQAYVQVRKPLNLAIRTDTLLCLGQDFLLYVQGSETDTGHYSFFWDGALSADNYFRQTAEETRYFSVRMLNNCDGSEMMDSVEIQVRDSLKLKIISDSIYCYGETVKLNPVLSGGHSGAYSLLWKEADGTVLGNSPSYSTVLKADKELHVVLNDGCTNPSDSVILSLQTRPPLSIGQARDTLLCFGQFFRFEPTITGGTGVDYGYSGYPIDSSTLTNGSLIKTGQVQRIIAVDGCSEPDTMHFELILLDSLLAILPSDTFLCEGFEIQLTPVISGGRPDEYTYFWQGISVLSGQKRIEVMHDTTLVFRLEDGCSEPVSDTIRLFRFMPPGSDFILSDTQFCAPDSVRAISGHYSNTAGWHWRSEGLHFDTTTDGRELIIQVPNHGKYTIQLTISDSNGCLSIPQNRTLEAFPYPIARFTLSDSVIDRNTGVDLFIHKNQSITSQWLPGNINDLGGGHFYYMANDTGQVSIRHQAVNQWGCTAEFEHLLKVKEPFGCYVPNAFHPSGFSENHIFLPRCEPWTEYELLVYSRWGQLVFESNADMVGWNGTYMGVGDPLPGGVYVYLLRVKNEYKEVFQSKGTITLIK